MTPSTKRHLVTRSLTVTEMVCPECEEIITEGLGALSGVQEVKACFGDNQVTVTYDLFETHFGEVEHFLTEISYPPADGFIQRKKRDWIRYTEKNELDNLNHKAPCCSKPPTGA
ncbi:MAG: heavy-metal-associated domain-containing protein [Magnetococcales bacterium]|nr:heavy-metal-associated domain-containing protein [Magnetococcales bacterium]